MKSWMSVAVLFVVLTSCALAAPALKEQSKYPPIVGEWVVERWTQDAPGSRTDAEYVAGQHRYGFTADGRWTGVGSEPGRYKIDPKAAPSTIQLTHPGDKSAEEANINYAGTFHIDGNSLILRLSAPGEVTITMRLRRASDD